MSESAPSRSDLYLRFTHQSLLIVLLLVLSLGIMGLAMTLQPDGAISRVVEHASWLFPIASVLIIATLQTSMRRQRFTPGSPEVRAVMNDELRRSSMDRARMVAFVVVLASQLPIALLLSQTPHGFGFGADIPAFRAVLAMAIATITLGMTVFLLSFLIFDRE